MANGILKNVLHSSSIGEIVSHGDLAPVLTANLLSCKMGLMNYIVLDLEWNQAEEANDARSKLLASEIIEIGAVKLNSRMETAGAFHELIRPQLYSQMHQATENLIQIHMEELENCRTFPEVIGDFLDWCGSECLFATWGSQDLTELQRNLRFYHMEALAEGPFRFYDIQKLFSLEYEDGKSRRSLEYAVDFFDLEKDASFHRALHDALYTAQVFQKIRSPQVLQRFSFDTFSLPKSHREEIHVVFDSYAKYISRAFADREALLADKEVIATRCYLCHHNLRRKIRWFSVNAKFYYSLSWCEKHGFMKGKIRIKRTEEDTFYAIKTTKLIDEEAAAQIAQKKEHIRQLRREKRHREN